VDLDTMASMYDQSYPGDEEGEFNIYFV
jgi:hypothetical protein